MVKMHKLTKGGQTIYPATITDAVVNPKTRKSLTVEMSELNYKIISSDNLLKKASVGKNLLNPSSLLKGKKVNDNGIIESSSVLAVSAFVPIKEGESLTASSSDGFFQCHACLYNDDFNPILSSLVTGTSVNDKDMTLNNDCDASYAVFTFRLPSESSKNMIESGNIATDYVSYTDNYENEKTFKTIGDRLDELTGKDITSVSFEPGRVSNTTGIASGAGRHYKISCKGYAQITARIYRSNFGGVSGVGYAFMDAQGAFVAGGSNTESEDDYSVITVDIPVNAVEFRNTYASSGELQESIKLSDLTSYEIKEIAEQVESKAETKDLINTRLGLIRDGGKPLKIFFLGNSFSVQSADYFVKLCKANSIDVTVGISYIGGATLQAYDKYYGNVESAYYKYMKGEWISHQDIIGSSYKKKNIEKLQDEDWDIIFMQQGSAEADAYSTYQPYGTNVYGWCKNNAQISFAEMRWLMPWAWSDKRLASNATSGKATTNEQMYKGIANATKKMLEDLSYKLSPNGTAIQNLYPQYTQNDIFGLSGDGQHLEGNIALFTAGYCLFRTIIPSYYPNVNLNLEYEDEKITADMFASAKQAVENAINNPYTQTSVS